MNARLWVSCFALVSLWGCEENQTVAASQFAGPTGIVLAGTDGDRLFVANAAEDAVRVVDVSNGVTSNRFVESPSVFNPLRIPVGPSPTELAVSNDGRVVAVLDPVNGVLRLIDADTLRIVRDEAGEVYRFPLGSAGSQPVAFEPDPRSDACLEPCLGRFFVSLSGGSRIVLVSFVESEAGFRMALEQVFDTGGRPQRMAASPDGAFVFAVDAESDEVIRVDRTFGTVDRRAIGAPASDLAVSGDGSVLLVARPGLRDVLVMDDVTAGLSILPADSRSTPRFRCVSPCTDQALCEGAHPANRSLCSTAEFSSLGQGAVDYDALFVGVIPRRIEALSTQTGHPSLELACVDQNSEEFTEQVTEYAVVVGEDNFGQTSSIRWVRVHDAEGTLQPQLAENGFCNVASIDFDENDDRLQVDGELIGIDSYLDACPEIPLDSKGAPQARFECLRYTPSGEDPDNPILDDEKAGVLILPGQRIGSTQWRLDWEPALNGLRRRQGGGRLDDPPDGFLAGEVLRDIDLDLSQRGIRVGDIVRVLSTPDLTEPACAAQLESGAPCELERRVIGFAEDGIILGPSALDPTRTEPEPLPVECFPSTAQSGLSYEIRAGDSFTVGRAGNTQVGRVRIGEIFGPGGRFGQNEPVVFRIRPDLEARSELSACERYPEEGQSPLSPQLRRTTTERIEAFFFSVVDATLIQLPGRLVGGGSGLRGGQGASPQAAFVARAPRDRNSRATYMFVTYEATDTVLIFRPDLPAAIGENDYDVIN